MLTPEQLFVLKNAADVVYKELVSPAAEKGEEDWTKAMEGASEMASHFKTLWRSATLYEVHPELKP